MTTEIDTDLVDMTSVDGASPGITELHGDFIDMTSSGANVTETDVDGIEMTSSSMNASSNTTVDCDSKLTSKGKNETVNYV